MVTINLFPWREQERLYENKRLNKMLLIAVSATLTCLLVVYLIIAKYNTGELHRVQLLKEEWQDYQRQQSDQKNKAYAAQLSQAFFRYQKATSHFFMEMVERESKSVCFTEIAREHHRISFFGKARSITDLTDYLLNWKASYLFSEIKIKEIKRQENQLVQFYFQGIEKSLA